MSFVLEGGGANFKTGGYTYIAQNSQISPANVKENVVSFVERNNKTDI